MAKSVLHIELSSGQASQLLYSVSKDDMEEYTSWICKPLKAVGLFRKIATYFFRVHDSPHSTQSFSPKVSSCIAMWTRISAPRSDAATVVSLLILIMLISQSTRLITRIIHLTSRLFARTHPSNMTSKEDEDAPAHADHRGMFEPRTKLEIECGPLCWFRGVAHSVPGYDHTDGGKGSSLQPTSEHPSDLTDKEDDPSYDPSYDQRNRDGSRKIYRWMKHCIIPVLRLDKELPTALMPVTVECSNPGPSLSLNVAHSAGSEGVAHSVPGYDHTDGGKASSPQPTLEHPSDLTDREDNPSYDRQNTDGLEENTLMDETLSTGMTSTILLSRRHSKLLAFV
ncbi:hypothetical protein BU17DRAFT_90460 [Hysterangium stoloniferum]|nr:hypothetical protein BU17DRAFT_90460 [Hysterangium stoloniferum]